VRSFDEGAEDVAGGKNGEERESRSKMGKSDGRKERGAVKNPKLYRSKPRRY